jgi:hypothetical protein
MPDFKIAKSIFLKTCAVTLICFFVGEVALRIYHHYAPTDIFFKRTYFKYRGKPFAYNWNFKLNSQGFKDQEFSQKKENLYRIVAIGDSTAFGVVPYEYNYLTLLESQLKRKGLNVEVLNLGIHSIGPKDYLVLLLKEALALQPDMVLLSFFIGDDFNQSSRKGYEYSFLASALYNVINKPSQTEAGVVRGRGVYCDDCPTHDHQLYLEIESSRSWIYVVDNNRRLDRKMGHALYYLKQIRSICEQGGIKLVVTVMPDELQINPDLLSEVKKVYYPNLEDERWDITLPNRTLTNQLADLGFDAIDLYDDFANAAQPLYKPKDAHMNIAGNRLAADVVANYIGHYLKQEK